jgi:hypothetical protein
VSVAARDEYADRRGRVTRSYTRRRATQLSGVLLWAGRELDRRAAEAAPEDLARDLGQLATIARREGSLLAERVQR